MKLICMLFYLRESALIIQWRSTKFTHLFYSLVPTNVKLLNLCVQELENKRKERAQVAYERKKQLNKLRVKAEKVAEEKLGPQLEIIAPIKY